MKGINPESFPAVGFGETNTSPAIRPDKGNNNEENSFLGGTPLVFKLSLFSFPGYIENELRKQQYVVRPVFESISKNAEPILLCPVMGPKDRMGGTVVHDTESVLCTTGTAEWS